IPNLCHEARFPPHGSCGLCVVEIGGNSQLTRACATQAKDGMCITTRNERINETRKRLLELLLSSHTGDCKAPCQLACPGQTDCQGYIALINEGNHEAAYKRMMEAHPFPGSLARVCPRLCETKCRRGIHDSPVNIAGLKRYVTDLYGGTPYTPETAPSTGKKIAIVGGGPAGLTAAYFLKQAGHDVNVYEHMPKMGGLLRYGIPEYRLPKAILDNELAVLARIGIQFAKGVRGGKKDTLMLHDLQNQYDAVIIAIGAWKSHKLNIPGEKSPGVIGGINFLRNVALGNTVEIGSHVAVIGGSNTAIDTARTALRMGAKKVTVTYRRTRDEMPAEHEEIMDAENEGIDFKFLVAPVEITGEKVKTIRLQVMTLGEPDPSGRRVPVPIEGKEELVEADTIIVAIGQAVVLDDVEDLRESVPFINADPSTFKTILPGVFALGDATGQSAYAIDAIGHGRKAATAVHDFLVNEKSPWEMLPDILVTDSKTPSDFANIPKIPRETADKNESANNFEEVHQSITKSQAITEASRCLSCGCGDYNECKLINLTNMYEANPDKFHKPKKNKYQQDNNNPLFTYDPNKCIHCGLCIKVCSEDKAILTMANRGFKTTVIPCPQSNCKKCGNCKDVCPVGARI
ncbi:MAG: FAD-dependent oxidoreductase, partial [Defluviitaleaceae bacterium]|nr:FAD-dependent oxidoreductase [Defluviitaleaceae bacterium]